MKDEIEKSKTISSLFNRSSVWEEFIVNLDLLNISLEEAQKIWSKCNAILVKYSSLRKYCNNDIIDFKHLFKVKNSNIRNIACIPYVTKKTINAFTFTPEIEMRIMRLDGKIQCISHCNDLAEDTRATYGIDIFKEMIDNMLYEIGEKYGK